MEKVPETQEKTSEENKPAESVKYATETKNKIIPKESAAKEAVGAAQDRQSHHDPDLLTVCVRVAQVSLVAFDFRWREGIQELA